VKTSSEIINRMLSRAGLPERIRVALAPPGAPVHDGAVMVWSDPDEAYTDGRNFLLAGAVRRGWGVSYVAIS
jgi:hypothetical protein